MASKEVGVDHSHSTNPALDPDLDHQDQPGLEFAQFAAGCFWGVELAFQRVEGVVKTEAGSTQAVCPYTNLLSVFWARHDPTTLNRQGGDVGTQYRSGIYYYSEAQARLAQESLEVKQMEFKDKKIVTEILPAKRFYRAEEYHQQYLEKGGGGGSKQSPAKGCNDPIRCYG
ncbi:hypothetical protein F0562_023344 [Nyssa sinensis]|uniref:peptide-methionine (S)-S-oxide reductase n=1 Tax=Nyssa sinensis TaxID=561372 RepID=A0A5J5BKF5_9ASTE|nr:hypothetical protein F0562_023344 [Nyssa sinensis]